MPAGAELPRRRPGARRAQPLARAALYPVALRAAPRRRVRLADQHVLLRWTPVADGRRRHPEELGYGYRIADQAVWKAWLRARHRPGRAAARGRPAPPARGRHGPGGDGAPPRRVPSAAPRRCPGARSPPRARARRRRARARSPAPRRAARRCRPAAPAGDEDVTAAILEIVAAQTGYPADMLDPDLDLEADLGIDTVKQAEMFAAIRERYGIDRDDTPQAARLPHPAPRRRLRRRAHRPPTAPAPPPEPVVAAPEPSAGRAGATPAGDEVTAAVLEIVAAQTGYPADMLDPDLDLEADLGIDTVKQAEMFAAIRERYGIDRDDALKLRDYPTLRHVVGFVEDRTAAAPPTAPPAPEPAPRRAAPEPRSPRRAAGAPRRRRTRSRPRSWRSSPRRPATRPTCSTPTSTSKPTSASTPSNRPRCSPPSASATASTATTRLKLRDYPTLRHVVGFVEDRTGTPRRARRTPRRRRSRAAGRADADAPASRAACRCRCCGRRSSSASRPGSCSAPGSRVIVVADRGGVGAALTVAAAQARRRGRRRPSDGGPRRRRLLAARARRRAAARRARRRRLARRPATCASSASPRSCATCPTEHVPDRGDAARRPPRLRRRGRDVRDGRRGDRLREGAAPRAPGHADQGGRLRARRARPPSRPSSCSPRRCATRAPSRSATRTACAGRSALAEQAPPSRPGAPADARDDVRRSPARPAASSRRSPPTSRRRRAAARSTCSTSRRAPTPATRTSRASPPTATA